MKNKLEKIRNHPKYKSLEQRYVHFKERLQQRYSLEISFEEWKKITIKKGLYKTSQRAVLCLIEIQGMEILGIMQSGTGVEENFMRTVFRSEGSIKDFPLPVEIKKVTNKAEFGLQVEESLISARKIIYETDKELFEKYPAHIASIAKHSNQELTIYIKARFIKSMARQLFPQEFK